MQTINSTRPSGLTYKNAEAFGRKSSPPKIGKGPQISTPTCDDVALSGKAAEPKRSTGLLAVAMLGGLAAVTLAGCTSGAAAPLAPAVQEAVLPELQNFESAPVELMRTADGEVVVNLGIDDQVVNPDTGSHYRLPGVDNASWSQRGETVCQQALDLGGECQADNIALVTTPRGTLIIEQNEANSIDIYSQDGGHTGVSVQAEGVQVQTHRGQAYFANDGSVRTGQ